MINEEIERDRELQKVRVEGKSEREREGGEGMDDESIERDGKGVEYARRREKEARGRRGLFLRKPTRSTSKYLHGGSTKSIFFLLLLPRSASSPHVPFYPAYRDNCAPLSRKFVIPRHRAMHAEFQ